MNDEGKNDELLMLNDELTNSSLITQHSALKVPEIRFKGFSGEWQNKEIGSILAETKRPVELIDNELYQLVTVKRRNEGVMPRSILKGKDILVKNYYSVKAGDYLISKRQVVHGANGIVPASLDNAVVSNEYLVVTDGDEITAKFWTVISKKTEMHKLFFISSYGVDIEKLVFDVTDWKNRRITIPNVVEQNKITDHFQKLDSLINQHQQQHDQLSNLKKAMLEKMFPKAGETIPEIRFKGFSGEWEVSALRDISEITTGKLDANAMKKNGKYDFYTSGIKKYKIDIPAFEGPAITIAGNGATVGYMHLADGEFNAYQRTYVLTNFKANRYFLFCNIGKELPIKISQEVRAGNIPYIVLDMLTDLEIKLPFEKEEQTAIGNYFQKLDALINQHQQQITKLTHIKQACLSKMFV